MIYNNLTELVGNTPLMELGSYNKQENVKGKILAKLEYFNPCSSIKDRVALYMIEEAQKSGKITPDTVIVEPTSGNTGIGLAFVCSVKGLKLIITMPETMSPERVAVLKALGAEVILTEGSKGMSGAIDKANEIAKNYKSFIPSQFDNPANPKAHRYTTAPEIIKDTAGNVDAIVAGFGTGGTISGIGEYMKEYNNNIKIIGVEPFDSPVVTKGTAGPHKIQGIGANFIPDNLNVEIMDEIITIRSEEAFETCRKLAKTEGLLVGISSGAALYAATQVAKRPEYAEKVIVVILPDTGERYLSTGLFD